MEIEQIIIIAIMLVGGALLSRAFFKTERPKCTASCEGCKGARSTCKK